VRVLHVITRLTSGGSDRRMHDVIRAVDAEHEVVTGRDAAPDDIAALSVRPGVTQVHQLDQLVREVSPPADSRALLELVRIMRAGRYDVVQTHQAKGGLLGRVAAAGAGIPAVFHSASMASFGPGYPARQSQLFQWAERTTAPLTTRYLVVGRDLSDRLSSAGIPGHRIEIIRSSLDLSRFTPPGPDEKARLRRELDLPPEAVVLVYVGLLDPRKGVLTLPGLAALVHDLTQRDVRMEVAGEGPLRTELQEIIGATRTEGRVRLLGHIAGVADLMRAADVLVLPSVAEGVPQVLVQACACGLPFAAFDVDGVGEVLELGAVGAKVPIGDHRALARAVAALVGSPRGPGLGAEARRQWEPDVVASQYREVYGTAVSARRAR
jgi:glycosyltransferase involved in cell wall biosynthesis